MNIYPTLIIGVGGSGKLVCKFIKKYFAERFPKEWLNSSTKLPPIVDIVVMETEPGKEKEEYNILGLPDVQTVSAYIDKTTLKAMQSKTFLSKNPEIANWLCAPLPVNEIIGGAGQIRQAGRLAFFRHRTAYGKIQKIITTALDNIRSDDAVNLTKQLSKGKIEIPDPTPRCYIVSSVCGGTGSGMVFDIAGIVNKAKVRANLIAFLPKMFESKIDLTESIWQIWANTYATLKEVNHYMTGGNWSVWYDEKAKDSVSIENKLFNYSFLVDKESETVDLLDRSRVSPLVAEFLFNMISELEHPLHSTKINEWFLDANISGWVNGLGVAIISFPLGEIRDLLMNWGTRDFVARHISMDFSQSDIDALILDPNTGWINYDFSYKKWELSLLEKGEYSTHSVDTLIKRKGSLESKILEEKNRIKREYNDDLKRIRDGYDSYLEKVKGWLKSLSDSILCSKGPAYFGATMEKFKQELHAAKSSLENDQQKLNANVEQLGDTVEKQIKALANIGKKSWFAAIGWAKRIHPHMDSVLRQIRDLFGGMLKAEKHKYSLRIIAELENMIGSILAEYSSLMEKLRNIRLKGEGEEKRLLSALVFGSEAHIKVKSADNDVKNFYNTYVEPGLPDMAANLRNNLVGWKTNSEEMICGNIKAAMDDKIKRSHFDSLTILDAMKNDMEELGRLIQDCITNKSMPLLRQAGKPTENRFFISGFEKSDLKSLPALPDDVSVITSNFEQNKRKLIFVRLSAGCSLQDLGPYDLADKYAKAYDDAIKKGHEWIHIQKEAAGFEDPLGLSIGLEEESLIKTCLDVGILYVKKGNHFMYEDGGSQKTLKQGIEKAIGILREDQNIAKLLKKKLTEFFNGKDATWIVEYLNDHLRDKFANDKAFNDNHLAKYKNTFKGNEFALTQHKIPSYILTIIKQRLGQK